MPRIATDLLILGYLPLLIVIFLASRWLDRKLDGVPSNLQQLQFARRFQLLSVGAAGLVALAAVALARTAWQITFADGLRVFFGVAATVCVPLYCWYARRMVALADRA